MTVDETVEGVELQKWVNQTIMDNITKLYEVRMRAAFLPRILGRLRAGILFLDDMLYTRNFHVK